MGKRKRMIGKLGVAQVNDKAAVIIGGDRGHIDVEPRKFVKYLTLHNIHLIVFGLFASALAQIW